MPSGRPITHEGTKVYGERFDLVYQREAAALNAIWQADHTELDILVRMSMARPGDPGLILQRPDR
jgi:putative transposase